MMDDAHLLARLRAESSFDAIRAQGAGGQNVNKVSSAVQLRFDVGASSLPSAVKARLLALPDQRISSDGVVIIKAQTQRSQTQNLEDALQRLLALVRSVARAPRRRVPTQPTMAARRRRLEDKLQRSALKARRASAPSE
jgi:ribosome-associated protein